MLRLQSAAHSSASAHPLGAAALDVTFHSVGSYDPDGSLGNFRWTLQRRVLGADFTDPSLGGIYQLLTVYDNRGQRL
jgi:hypothetical protein